MTTTIDPLLHAVLANPEYDIVRLVYADALEEAGDGDRAEFIRWQIQRRGESLTDRWNNLSDWFGDAVIPPGSVSWERGFVLFVRCSLVAWCGETCIGCNGLGETSVTDFDGRDYHRGDCPRCHGTGRTPGHGAGIVARHPVERVEFTDAVIHPSGGNDTYYVGGLGMWPREEWSRLENHPTRLSAIDALSAAAIRWARTEAVRWGLVPDVWSKT